jgi:hypothetical protein
MARADNPIKGSERRARERVLMESRQLVAWGREIQPSDDGGTNNALGLRQPCCRFFKASLLAPRSHSRLRAKGKRLGHGFIEDYRETLTHEVGCSRGFPCRNDAQLATCFNMQNFGRRRVHGFKNGLIERS